MLFQSLALLLTPVALAAIQVTSPGADIWWVDESQNVVHWTGEAPPTDFVTYINNADTALLPVKFPLAAITQTYMQSLAVPAQKFNPGKGYVIELVDILNSTNVYAASEPFEIKPLGAAYPSAQPTNAATTAALPPSGASGSAAPAGSNAAAASATPASSAGRNAAPVLAAAAVGAAAYIWA